MKTMFSTLRAWKPVAALLVGMLAMAPTALAQDLGLGGGEDDLPVTVSAELARDGAENLFLAVRIDIADGWHVYGPGDGYDQQTVFTLAGKPAGVEAGEFAPDHEPKKHVYDFDPDSPRMEYFGSVVYGAPLTLGEDAAAGKFEGSLEINICNDQGCLPPKTIAFEVNFDPAALQNLAAFAGMADQGTDGEPAGEESEAPESSDDGNPPTAGTAPTVEAPKEKGITAGFLLAAVIAGLLTIATPCVFPMLPLTVSILTKRAEKQPGRTVPNALVYGAGMFFSLAGIGLAMSLVFGVSPTELAQNEWFNLGIFTFLMLLAMSLFGMFDLRLPSFLTNWSQGKASGEGSMGLFFMGVTLAFTSFSCAAPFAGVLVVEARESFFKGLVGMSVYAGTFSIPFIALALFPGLMAKLPRSGGWLNAVKVVMGFVEVAAAFKFLRAADRIWEWGFFSFDLVLSIWVACALLAGLYLLGYIVLPHDTKPESIGVPRLLWAIVFIASAVFMIPGLFGRPLPPFIESFIIRDAPAQVAALGGSVSGGEDLT
ncbi:MAG: protein-disulfide reductase DsbD family protein, partial [Planctomycetota bacterium]